MSERFKLLNMGSQGQSLVEYGLVLALIAVASIGGLQLLGENLSRQVSQIASSIGSIPIGTGGMAMAATPMPNAPTLAHLPVFTMANLNTPSATPAPITASAAPSPSMNTPNPSVAPATTTSNLTYPVPSPDISTAIANPNCSNTYGCGSVTNDSSNW